MVGKKVRARVVRSELGLEELRNAIMLRHLFKRWLRSSNCAKPSFWFFLASRLQKRRYAHDGVEAYPAPVEFEWKDSLHPMSSATPAKAPFLPSKWEAKKVMRLVMAMRSEQYQKSVDICQKAILRGLTYLRHLDQLMQSYHLI